MDCPYCNQQAEFIDSKHYYGNGQSYGMIYLCKPCDAICGVHGNTKKPLGTLAKPLLRELRKCCHAIHDRKWKLEGWHRGAAYKRLANMMEMTQEEAHIGKFRENDCLKLLQLLVEEGK